MCVRVCVCVCVCVCGGGGAPSLISAAQIISKVDDGLVEGILR